MHNFIAPLKFVTTILYLHHKFSIRPYVLAFIYCFFYSCFNICYLIFNFEYIVAIIQFISQCGTFLYGNYFFFPFVLFYKYVFLRFKGNIVALRTLPLIVFVFLFLKIFNFVLRFLIKDIPVVVHYVMDCRIFLSTLCFHVLAFTCLLCHFLYLFVYLLLFYVGTLSYTRT